MVDQSGRRRALGMIPYGLYVVGVGRGDEVGGYTANWISQASFDPPLLMLAVKRDARHHALIEKHGILVVNVLDSTQKRIAAAFMRWRDAKDGKIGDVAYSTGVTGAPILVEAPVFVECRVRRIVPGGDHDIVVAEVVEAVARREARPLLLSDTGWSYGG